MLGRAERGVAVRGEGLAEVLDDSGIKLGAGAAAKLGDRGFLIHRAPVGAVAGHRVVCIADGDDPGAERDLIAR